MFPTFISILDIQSWWEVPSIAHFCSLFRTAFNLLDFDIEDLEEALLTDGTEETSWLQELIVRLLSGCLPNNEISTFNYQMFLRRLFRQKCHDQYNPFNTDIDFQLLPLRTKVDILHALCDFRLDADDVLDQLKNLESDSLRVEPLGYDDNQSAYWYFYGTRLYREDFKNKNSKKEKSVWQVISFTEEDWFQLAKKFKKAASKTEKQLYRTLTENFLPELPRLFREKERLARKRLLENQPRRTSSRIRNQEVIAEEEEKVILQKQLEVEKEKQKLEEERRKIKREEAYERRTKLREQSEDRQSEQSDERYEMAGGKIRDKKTKSRQRQNSESSASSKDHSSIFSSASNRTSSRNNACSDSKTSTSATSTTTVGRQTNNSLACATGQIVIQPVSNPHRKKLKTSQVFRQTDEDLQTGMHKILDYVKNHDDAWPFIEPVEEEYAPNYYSVIRKPMDIQRMEERLDAGHYKTFSRFRADFQLIVDNCRLYNGADNEYTEMVDNLLKVFERATDRYLDEITSTDEEIAVEYPDLNKDNSKLNNKRKKNDSTSSSKRKPMLAAQTDKKKERSRSADSLSRNSDCSDITNAIETNKKEAKKESLKGDHIKNHKKQSKNNRTKLEKQIKTELIKKNHNHKNSKLTMKNVKHAFTPSPIRSRSRSFSRSPSMDRWSSSPPPSWPPSSPDDRFDFSPKKISKNSYPLCDDENTNKSKTKHDKWKEAYKEDFKHHEERKAKEKERSMSPPKYKDKHNKLRETIEKLKAKSEISNKLKEKDYDYDRIKEQRASPLEKVDNKIRKQNNKSKSKLKHKNSKSIKSDAELDDGNSTVDSVQSENRKQNKNSMNNKNANAKNAAIEALTLATEQTLKDINKWLDDTPKFSEFSSASNSPSHFSSLDDFDSMGSKVEQDFRKKLDKTPLQRKDISKDIKRRPFRDPAKLFRRREIQRTIDRLQPGKSKGNLISSIQNANKPDELFPLGPLSKIKDTKNSLIVKTDEGAPKLSLGSVLDSFGKHKFVDDPKKDEDEKDTTKKEETLLFVTMPDVSVDAKLGNTNVKSKSLETKSSSESAKIGVSPGKATPNLSAWFKAFGAPKMQPPHKKGDSKLDNEKGDDKGQDSKKDELKKVVPIPESSPTPDSPIMQHGQPTPRQRKISTGSSMSERSSFSQDMDSPRVGIDERLGAYPAPYPSPLHKSPSGASPVMASPRPDVSPKAASYPTFNGQIRVGFYQDTVSTKSSPDKSCSPRDNPQSPYAQYSEHVYTPPTTQNSSYSYNNPPYYSQTPSYSTSNPTPPYNCEQNVSPSYYDTNKPLTDQYQAKLTPNYANSPVSNTQLPSPIAQQPSPIGQQPSANIDAFRQEQVVRIPEKQQTAMFPVKKRAYNDNDMVHVSASRYDIQHKSVSQEEQYNNRNVDMGMLAGRQVSVDSSSNSPLQNMSPVTKETSKQYVHQNIPEPRNVPTQSEGNQQGNSNREQVSQQNSQDSLHNVSYSSSNTYSYSAETGYPLNIPTTRTLEAERSIDITKYTNMGYSGSEIGFTRTAQYNRADINYSRSTPTTTPVQSFAQTTTQNLQAMRYSDTAVMNMGYKGISMNMPANNLQTSQLSNLSNTNVLQNVKVTSENVVNCLGQNLDGYKPEMTIPRPSYSTPTSLDMDQSLNMRGNLSNLTHIVDRYQTDERMLGLQTSASSYYSEKNITSAHMFSKPMATSSSGLPMFSQSNMAMPYSHNIQATATSMYNRPMAESNIMNQEKSNVMQQQLQEKKSKRRKSTKSGTPPTTSIVEPVPNSSTPQGFQSYAGLKNTSAMEPSAISLKTSSVVPGSAFNFGPTPTGLGLSSGLYGDKDAYPNFLEDFRAAPNYYMAAAAAAHHRSTPETNEKPVRTTHQSNTAQATSYPFIGAPQPRPPSYPLGGPFMTPHQAPLMDARAPLYQQYLQAEVLHQGLLGPAGAYPTGYHPALSMRQPYDSMTRPSWL